MIQLLFDFPSYIKEWDEKINSLLYKIDSPFTGMIIFIVLLAISFIAIRSYSGK